MRWIWNAAKDVRNQAKHGLPLSVGEVGLADPLHLSVPDPHPDGDRWKTICAVGNRTLVVIHTWPDDSEDAESVGRIISARFATRRERKMYEHGS